MILGVRQGLLAAVCGLHVAVPFEFLEGLLRRLLFNHTFLDGVYNFFRSSFFVPDASGQAYREYLPTGGRIHAGKIRGA